LSIIGLACLSHGPAGAAPAPFYAGKTITVVEGREPGSLSDIRTKVAVKYMLKYLAGSPAAIYQYMPAAGGIAAANHIAHVAKPDGLTIGNIGTGLYQNGIFGGPGVRFKLEDFAFLGSPEAGGPYTLAVRPQLGLDTVEKLRAYKGLRFAQRSVGHRMYILDRIFAFVLDLKEPKWILGYTSQELRVAMERGEADALSNAIPSFLSSTPEWLKSGYAVPVVLKNSKGQGAEVTPGFPQDRPTIDQFADTETKRAILRLHDATSPGGSPFIVHKDTSPELIRALREAFDKAWKDAEFAREYAQMTNDPADTTSGAAIEQVLRQRPTDPKMMEFYKQLIGPGPLPTSK
jgi:tripartite-type tricarboxylate transporter receptor subunit TctC